jgi:hypothetical protein
MARTTTATRPTVTDDPLFSTIQFVQVQTSTFLHNAPVTEPMLRVFAALHEGDRAGRAVITELSIADAMQLRDRIDAFLTTCGDAMIAGLSTVDPDDATHDNDD